MRLFRWGVRDVDTLAASLLHDTLEDCVDDIVRHFLGIDPSDLTEVEKLAYATEWIVRDFGIECANIVRAVTNEPFPPGLSRAGKNALYISHVERVIAKHPNVFLVKFADYMDNGAGLYHNNVPGNEGMVRRLAAKYRPLADVFEAAFNANPTMSGLRSTAGTEEIRTKISSSRSRLDVLLAAFGRGQLRAIIIKMRQGRTTMGETTNKRSTSIAAALVVGTFALGLTGCGTDDEATAQPEPSKSAPTSSAAAASTAAAELPVRPEPVLLDMDKTAMDPAVVEAYANPNIDQEISAAAEEFIKVGLSFPELQKGSHTPSEADLEVLEPVRPLVDKGGYWDEVVEKLSSGEGIFFPPYVAAGVTLIDDAGKKTPYLADDSGISFVFKNDDMKIVYAPFENEVAGVKVENLKARIMFTTVDGEVVNIDRTLFLHFYQNPDGTWDVWQFSGTVDDSGVSKTQEELDALPAL